MITHPWFIFLLSFNCSTYKASLDGAPCGQKLSTVFAESLIYKYAHKLEEGFKNCLSRCVKNLMCETFSYVNASCQQYTRDGKVLASFNDKCKRDEDCSYKHGHCLQGVCSCLVGYSFNFKQNLCVKACASYGPHFSVYKNHSVTDCNIKISIKTPTLERCIELCRDESTFTCISADYCKKKNHCYLCDKTWADTPPAKRGKRDRQWSLIYRHC